jgi:hypothetical protein
MNAGRVSPSLALAAYAEAWISGAKVIVFGNALSPLPERLLERGARHVHVYDSDAERVAEATAQGHAKQISYGPLDQAGSTLRDGVFDFGIVEDLSATRGDPELLLAPLGRALSRRGMALIAAQNPDVSQRLIRSGALPEQPIGYYDFYDAVSRHFDEVRMLGQTPFIGYAIADFSATDATDVRIDTAFLPSGAEEPEWFLALASALPVSPDAFSVIQLPLADVDLGTAEDTEAAERAAQAEARVTALEATLEQLRAQQSREASQEHKSQVQALKAELAKREEWLTGLESRAATADLRADEMQSELDRLKSENLKAKQELKQLKQLGDDDQRSKKTLDDGTRALKVELEQLRKTLEAEARRSSKSDAEARSLTQRMTQLNAELAESERQRKKLEEDARQQAKLVEAELQRTRAAEAELQRKAAEAELQRKKAAEAELQRKAAEAELQRKKAAEAELQRKVAEAELQRKKAAEASEGEVQPELRELEAKLVERAAEVGRLEEDLHKTERFGRQLIIEVSQLKSERASSDAAQAVTRLAARNAELEADLEAARWTISNLEANVGEEPTAAVKPPPKRREEAPRAEPFVPSSRD